MESHSTQVQLWWKRPLGLENQYVPTRVNGPLVSWPCFVLVVVVALDEKQSALLPVNMKTWLRCSETCTWHFRISKKRVSHKNRHGQSKQTRLASQRLKQPMFRLLGILGVSQLSIARWTMTCQLRAFGFRCLRTRPRPSFCSAGRTWSWNFRTRPWHQGLVLKMFRTTCPPSMSSDQWECGPRQFTGPDPELSCGWSLVLGPHSNPINTSWKVWKKNKQVRRHFCFLLKKICSFKNTEELKRYKSNRHNYFLLTDGIVVLGPHANPLMRCWGANWVGMWS